MRVRGNLKPDVVEVTAYEPIPNKAEVRVRENIVPFETVDPMTEETMSGFEYDEYIFVMDNFIGIEKSVRDNIESWLTTGRTLEVAPNATLYVTARTDAVDEYTQELIEGGIL